MSNIEYKVDMNGSCFTPYFRLPPQKGIKGFLKKLIHSDYCWNAYLVFKHDSCTTGYDQWYWEDVRFSTPKEARDFHIEHPDGFVYNESISELPLS